jgi:hypothetical protein
VTGALLGAIDAGARVTGALLGAIDAGARVTGALLGAIDAGARVTGALVGAIDAGDTVVTGELETGATVAGELFTGADVGVIGLDIGAVVAGDKVAGETVAKQLGESSPRKLVRNTVSRLSAVFFRATTEARPAGSIEAAVNAVIKAPKFGGNSSVKILSTITIIIT